MKSRVLTATSLLTALLIVSGCCSTPIYTPFDPPPAPAKQKYNADELVDVPDSVLRKILDFEDSVDAYVDQVESRARIHNESL